ncbi:MAG: hypothetical protein OXC68_00930 [Aestuariivita sp.]|nr:hypothetical protein [Aestuariivita sp.]
MNQVLNNSQPNVNSVCRVVVYEEGDLLIAQCLEHDIRVFASDLKTLRQRFMDVFSAELVLSTINGGEPFASIDAASDEFFDMWPNLHQDLSKIVYADKSIAMAKAA